MTKCDHCDTPGSYPIQHDMHLCPICSDAADERVKAAKDSMEIRTQLQKLTPPVEQTTTVREDLFNARTETIIQLRDRINSDDSIPTEKKFITLATQLTERHTQLQTIINETQSEQRSIQVYLNDLITKLTREERDRLKREDLQYKPVTPKVVKPRSSKPRKTKLDTAELKFWAGRLGIEPSALQAIVLVKGQVIKDVAMALLKLKESLPSTDTTDTTDKE